MYEKPLKIEHVLLSGLCGIIGAALPDILEPATNPHHRSLFHSFATGTVNGFGFNATNKSTTLAEPMKVALRALIISYLSHLILDATTPRSIPFLA